MERDALMLHAGQRARYGVGGSRRCDSDGYHVAVTPYLLENTVRAADQPVTAETLR